ncbi:hypothetical protein ACIRRA_43480 [Nocardia sp. NPDC101769]|uniref:hypothetical protein n=1 Tax=Nocardia sp. NPDC101769 TaxID=3364333 RepID=UPI00380664FA
MRTSTRTLMTALLAAASLELTVAAVVRAEPDAAPTPVGYHALVDGGDVVATLDNGSFADSGDGQAVLVRNAADVALDSVPLSYSLDGSRHPITRQISADGRSLRLTPDTSHVNLAALEPVASPVENQLAMNDLINSVSIGTSVGSLIGTAIGATVGVGIGFALAGASCVVLSLGCVVAVLPIVALAGGVGGLVGLTLGGAPTTAFALYEYVRTLQSAPGQSKYGDYYRDRQQPAATPTAPATPQ